MRNLTFKRYLYFFTFLTMLSGCAVQKPVEFILLESTKKSGELKYNKLYYSATFIVKNYSNSKKSQLQIDTFAMDLGTKNAKAYDSYILLFYKESEITNSENLKKKPRDLDRYSDIKDHMIDFRWSNGFFLGKVKYKNGHITNLGNHVKLEDPPPLKN